MSKDKLVIDCDREWCWRIYWFLAEEQELGACVGEGDEHLNEEAPTEKEHWEYWVSAKAVYLLNPEQDFKGFYFESKPAAQKALNVAKQAMKQDRPLPEWAQKALAEGWKPPKGWKA